MLSLQMLPLKKCIKKTAIEVDYCHIQIDVLCFNYIVVCQILNKHM